VGARTTLLGALVALVLVLMLAPTVAGAAAPTSIEVHWDTLSGSTFKRAGDFTSDFSPVDDANGAFMLFGSANGAPELGFVKLRNTAGTVEGHWDSLVGTTFKRAGDAASDFSLADAGNGVWQFVATSGAPELGFVKLRAPAAKPVVLQPPTTVSTPVTVVLPLPKGRRHVRVKITIGWTWNGGRTRLSRIRIGHVPARATVTVTCKGPGCPKPHTRRARGRRVKTLVAHLHGGRYRAGDRLFVTISAPGLIAERAEITIRDGALPRVRALR
jgi:hypothetical protein